MLKYLLLLSLFATVYSSGETSWRFLKVEWDIDGDDVEFTITMDADYKDKFDWWGLAFAEPGDDLDHFDAWIINPKKTGQDRVLDGWAPSAGEITPDTWNSLTILSFGEVSNGDHVTVVSRKMDTGDENDRKFVEGEEFKILLAAGMYDANGGYAKHANDDRLMYGFEMSNDFKKILNEDGKEVDEDDHAIVITSFMSLLGLLLFVPY